MLSQGTSEVTIVRHANVQLKALQCGGGFESWGGDLPQSLPVCVVRVLREMDPFSIQNGARGVHPCGYVLGVILQYGDNVSDPDIVTPVYIHQQDAAIH